MRLIYAENAAYLLCSSCEYFGNCIIRMNNGGCTAYKILMQDAPTVEPKKGKWILGDSGQFKGVVSTCSVCGKKYLLGNIDYNYCPNCGARMEKSDG